MSETMRDILVAPCQTCGGTERVYRDCWNCDGEGEVEDTLDDCFPDETMPCHHCGGRGGYYLCAKCAPPEEDEYDDDDKAWTAL